MKPNFKQLHNPSPDYLRSLIDQIQAREESLSMNAIAVTLGVDRSRFRNYIIDIHRAGYRECPYTVQFALEVWAEHYQ